jgi:subtilisin family serine protease
MVYLLLGVAVAAPLGFAPERILVKPAGSMSEVAVHALLASHGAKEVGRVAQIGVRVVRVPALRLEQVLAALSRNPNIEFAEKDPLAQAMLAANDPSYSSQWHLPKIQSTQAWDISTGRRDDIIAVLDTGVSYNHPDLSGKVLQGYNFVSGNNNAADDHGHGTLVAGAATASSNNGVGVAGVAWKNLILPVKVLDASGSGSHSAIANGITYAADQGARVINLSLGSSSGSRTLENAVKYAWGKNSLLVAAAGNNGNNVLFYPAAYANVLGVSALNSNDLLPSWSSYGSHVSLSAPGVNILTTHIGGAYGYASGTSLAAPLVSGAAALVIGTKPELFNSEVRQILENHATDLGTAGYDQYFGHGRVDAFAAVKAAAGATVADVTAPLVLMNVPSPAVGTVEVLVDATDDVGVVGVELYLNGSRIGQSSAAAVAFTWDSTTVADGQHVLEARAYDAVGNVGSSGTLTVTVSNTVVADTTAPTVVFKSPANGASVSKTVTIALAASDQVGVVLVELFINGKRVGTSTSANPSFSWNTTKIARGEHRLQAYAHDAAGNIGTAAIIVYKR